MLKIGAEGLFQCGREISGEELKEIKETVDLFPRLSRQELALTLCEHLGWITASGSYKTDACLKLLEKLESEGIVKLPEKRGNRPHYQRKRPISFSSRTDAGFDIICKLKEMGEVGLEVVKDKASTEIWDEYVSRYHYLGYKRPFGTFLKYFIVSDKGILGCLLFAGAAKALGVRDKWIGWGNHERLRNLGWVINNTRFLIFKWVRVKNLASHVLGRIGRQIREDWFKRWGYRPVLMETFVDPRHYYGSCYRGSNWQYLGMTTGEGLVRKGKGYSTTPKMIFVKALVKDFRSVLCSDHMRGRVEG